MFLKKVLKAAQGIESLDTRYEAPTPYYNTMIAPMPIREATENPGGIASLGNQNIQNLMDMQRNSFSRFVPRPTGSFSDVGKLPPAPPASVPAFPQIGIPSLSAQIGLPTISPLPGLNIADLGSMVFPDFGNAGYF